ncbi:MULTISPECIES: GIY-YIG nuclease family protein [unclassified Sporosarcina]|uniref:GIY-YIG nuclease family protein n=1 Tax=unclassified Sporosarcina TaxID=2647733 RepID=UPI001304604F|nr:MULTISPECIES: GIY-YIG nuclease family protein [unclassified Sporosarcina]
MPEASLTIQVSNINILRQLPPQLLSRYGVYVFFDNDDQVLYTGKSSNLRKRIIDHFRFSHNRELWNSIQREEITKVQVYFCQKELDADLLERFFIRSGMFRGKYNISLVSERDEYINVSLGEEDSDLLLADKEKNAINKRWLQSLNDKLFQIKDIYLAANVIEEYLNEYFGFYQQSELNFTLLSIMLELDTSYIEDKFFSDSDFILYFWKQSSFAIRERNNQIILCIIHKVDGKIVSPEVFLKKVKKDGERFVQKWERSN